MEASDFDNRFSYHAPNDKQKELHQRARSIMHDAAVEVDGMGPDCREKSLAVTALEEAMLWTNAMIARNPDTYAEPQ